METTVPSDSVLKIYIRSLSSVINKGIINGGGKTNIEIKAILYISSKFNKSVKTYLFNIKARGRRIISRRPIIFTGSSRLLRLKSIS
jgi:hypothetical protein